MTEFVLACAFLYLSHLIPTAPGVRDILVEKLELRTFRLVYSLISLGAILWFVIAWRDADYGATFWAPSALRVWTMTLLMPLAFWLMIGRIMTPWGTMEKPGPLQGIYYITRFPGSWGILLWAGLHLLVVGDLKRVVAFGTFALIAMSALVKNEWVLKHTETGEARSWIQATRFFPGWDPKAVRGKGGRRPLFAALGLSALFMMLHHVFFATGPLYWL